MGEGKNISLKMVRETLEGFPSFAVPAGFEVRWYRQGYEGFWLKIQREADKFNEITRRLFADQFKQSGLLPDRQCFLFNAEGIAVATATAWFGADATGSMTGRVHWVAVLPGYQRRGLGNGLMTIVCARLRESGHVRAWLTTAAARLPAIRLYQKFGFEPEPRSQEEAETWRGVLEGG